MRKMAKKGYYAVQHGRNTGVYSSWSEAHAQVSGFPGAVFKKFDNESSAQSFASGDSGYVKPGSDNSSNNHGLSGLNNIYGGFSGLSRSSCSNSYSSASSYIKPSISTALYSAQPTASYSTDNTKKQIFYAVANGREIGIFKDWDSCKIQIDGYNSAKYKKFDSLQEARSYIELNKESSIIHNQRDISPVRDNIYRTSRSDSVRSNYYAVNFKNGDTKIYDNWDECKKSISGKQVTYKKFDSIEKANNFVSLKRGSSLSSDQKTLLTNEFLSRNSSRLLKEQQDLKPSIIYTDGSYFPNGANSGNGGIGVYYGPNDVRNVSERVQGHVEDSYTPEVHALDKAMGNIVKEIRQYNNGQGSLLPKYKISSDNEAAKNVLTKYGDTWTKEEFLNRKEGVKLYEMFQKYKEITDFYNDRSEIFNNHKFEIEWVKGHSGIDGNEIADELAKRGATYKQ